MEHLTIAMEQYLETVYALCAGGPGCRVSDIAAKLNVSKASVNSAMNVLSARGLVENQKYREVHLTEQGTQLAQLLSHKHAILQSLFTKVAGVEPALANRDACAIEHVISNETVQRISVFLAEQNIAVPGE
jgi:Mn-dependent DtxR family transcriptional regulator